jgi:Uncharacterized protein conserved in bacteria (DUF2188)
MSDKNIHVVPRDGRWAVEREDSQRASPLHDTQAEAEAAGRVTARREQVEFYLQVGTVRSGSVTATGTTRTRRAVSAPADHIRLWSPPNVLGGLHGMKQSL